MSSNSDSSSTIVASVYTIYNPEYKEIVSVDPTTITDYSKYNLLFYYNKYNEVVCLIFEVPFKISALSSYNIIAFVPNFTSKILFKTDTVLNLNDSTLDYYFVKSRRGTGYYYFKQNSIYYDTGLFGFIDTMWSVSLAEYTRDTGIEETVEDIRAQQINRKTKYLNPFYISNQGTEDTFMLNYCSQDKNSKKKICSCINFRKYEGEVNSVPDNVLDQVKNPKCYFTSCDTFGYKTQTQANEICNTNICINSVKIGNSNNIFNSNINQSCSFNLPDPVDPGNTGSPTDPGNTNNPTDPGNTGNPSNPTDPGNTGNPTDPGNTGNPTDPGNPSNPTNPTDSGNTGNPTTPKDPTDTNENENKISDIFDMGYIKTWASDNQTMLLSITLFIIMILLIVVVVKMARKNRDSNDEQSYDIKNNYTYNTSV
jgi:hypothetical protein